MGKRQQTKRRTFLFIEVLETRVVPSSLTIALSTSSDQFGAQIQTVQAYDSATRAAFGILDTGAAPLTFSASDQATFTANGNPIPISGSAQTNGLDGVGGTITGQVSQPGTILVDGIHAISLGYDQFGFPEYTTNFNGQSASTPGIQAFIGTPSGSSLLPAVTGTPIFNPSSVNPAGLAALVNLQGGTQNLSNIYPGLAINQPDLNFVSPSTVLTAQTGTTAPVTIPLSLLGADNYGHAGNQITVSPTPVDTSVSVIDNGLRQSNKEFLFDTGSQVTIISTALARALHINMTRPTTNYMIEGAGGTISSVPGFILTSLTVSTTGGGTLRFTNVPVSVLNIAPGIDGVLGMNLFNRGAQMLYNPYASGGASLSVSFYTNPARDSHGGVGAFLGTLAPTTSFSVPTGPTMYQGTMVAPPVVSPLPPPTYSSPSYAAPSLNPVYVQLKSSLNAGRNVETIVHVLVLRMEQDASAVPVSQSNTMLVTPAVSQSQNSLLVTTLASQQLPSSSTQPFVGAAAAQTDAGSAHGAVHAFAAVITPTSDERGAQDSRNLPENGQPAPAAPGTPAQPDDAGPSQGETSAAVAAYFASAAAAPTEDGLSSEQVAASGVDSLTRLAVMVAGLGGAASRLEPSRRRQAWLPTT